MQKPLTQLSQPPCLLPLGEMVRAHPRSSSEFYWNQVSEASQFQLECVFSWLSALSV